LRHDPLAQQILEEEASRGLRANPRTKQRRGPQAREAQEADDEEGLGRTPAAVAKKVLEVARAQKSDDGFPDDLAFAGGAGDSDDEGGDEDEEIEDVEVDEDGFVISGATEEDERALSLFLPSGGSGPKGGQTLADVILQKIKEHESRQPGEEEAAGGEEGEGGLSPKVIQVYGEIGKWLKNYKVGKLPKAFKVIPSLTNWEEVLSLTNPLSWSPAAMYEATNIFASNLNPRMAQRFNNLVLLPAVRQNIAEYKKLNFHYYRALRKALFKPAAFFKGIVLPMATEQCTLREALILSSVLAKASIPPMHVAACIARLCSMTPWYGTTSVLLAALVNKKCALPLQVVEALVSHFCAFASEGSQALPLIWHRALLIFVQRYKLDLSEDQRRRLMQLLRVHFHEGLGSEVRRELLAPKPGVAAVPGATTAGPNAMDVG